MTKGNVLPVIFLILLSCSKVENTFRVSGQLSSGAGQMIHLNRLTSTDMISIDSAQIDSSGYFSLKGMAPKMDFFAVYTDPDHLVYLLADDGDDISLSGDATDLPETYGVDGSEHSSLIRELTRAQSRTISLIRGLSKVFNDSIHSPNFTEIKIRLDSSYAEIVNGQRDFTFRFIEENLQSPASLMALYQQIRPRYYLLDPETDFRYFALVDSSLSMLYPESDAVRDLHRQVEELKQKNKFEEMSEARLGNGTIAPEIALPDPDGDTILLSSTRGKIVLLDFWAAWCSPCRQENPNLVKLYRKYSGRGFEIFQVSLDQTRDAWLKGIEEDHLDWIQVSDLQYWNSIVVPIYNIQGIPLNYLLDREGKIMDRNLTGDELEERLEKIFNP